MHAKQEKQAHEARALSAALQATDWPKVRRDFSESARTRVLAAAEQHLEAKQKSENVRHADSSARHAGLADPHQQHLPGADTGASAMPSEGAVEEMLQQRKALLDAGFDAEAEKVQRRLVRYRSSADRERVELEQRLFKQRLASLERDQQEQRERLAKAQAYELAEAEAEMREEIEALTEAQAEEHEEFELRITRAAALEEVELPRQLLKHRFKPSARLLSIRDALKRLPDDLTQANMAVGETKSKLLEQQRSVEQKEVSRWREKFLAAALGSEATSCIGQMLVAHKQAYDKALDRQQKQRHALVKTHKEASVALEATFRIAVWQLRNTTKKQAAMQAAGLVQPSAEAEAKGRADAKATARNTAAQPGTNEQGAITAEDRPNDASAWSCDDGLTAWAWYNQGQTVLRALTELQPRGMSGTQLLKPLLSHVEQWGGAVAKQRLQWVLQVGEVMRLDDGGRGKDDAACELYELLNHTIVPAEFNMEVVFETLLENCATCRTDIEPAFISFLGTVGCSELMASLRTLSSGDSELDEVRGMPELRDVPLTNIKKEGLVGTLDQIQIRQAVSVVDVTVPGLPLVYVNEAWEGLTGFERDEVVGLNARLLQGVATEEAAITRCMQAVRNKRPVSVCISNYRADGTRFRHNLSLHPLGSDAGHVEYMLSLSGDVRAPAESGTPPSSPPQTTAARAPSC